MKFTKHHITYFLVTAFAVTLFFACESNFEQVQKIGVLQNEPIGEAININLKYTEKLDSLARLKANLKSPEMLDYSNKSFPYTEFPQGIHLTVFDDQGKKSTVISEYAIIYSETDLIDLQGNVILATHDKDTLFAEQLYYDQKMEWLFTNTPVTLRSGNEIQHGNGFDSDSNFENFQVLDVNGIVYLDDGDK